MGWRDPGDLTVDRVERRRLRVKADQARYRFRKKHGLSVQDWPGPRAAALREFAAEREAKLEAKRLSADVVARRRADEARVAGAPSWLSCLLPAGSPRA